MGPKKLNNQETKTRNMKDIMTIGLSLASTKWMRPDILAPHLYLSHLLQAQVSSTLVFPGRRPV